MKKLFIFMMIFFTSSLVASNIHQFQENPQTFQECKIRLLKESDLPNFKDYLKRKNNINQSCESYGTFFSNDSSEDEKIIDIQENLKLKNFYSQYFHESDPVDEMYLIVIKDKIIGHIEFLILDELSVIIDNVEINFPLDQLKEYLSSQLSHETKSKILNISFSVDLEDSEISDLKLIFANTFKNFIQQELIPRLMKNFHEFDDVKEAHKLSALIVKDKITSHDPQIKTMKTKVFNYVGAYTVENLQNQTCDLIQKLGFQPYAIPFVNDEQLFYITNQ